MISFFKEVSLTYLDEPQTADWLEQTAHTYSRSVQSLEYIFVNDERLLQMNKAHLQHDYYTDILTFDYSDTDAIIGEIYISVDRVEDNAVEHNIPKIDELHRVMVHGLLHICGLDDHTPVDKEVMRKAENKALALRMF